MVCSRRYYIVYRNDTAALRSRCYEISQNDEYREECCDRNERKPNESTYRVHDCTSIASSC